MTKEEITQELDKLDIKYNPEHSREELFNLLLGGKLTVEPKESVSQVMSERAKKNITTAIKNLTKATEVDTSRKPKYNRLIRALNDIARRI